MSSLWSNAVLFFRPFFYFSPTFASMLLLPHGTMWGLSCLNVILFKSSFMMQLVCAGVLQQIALAKYSRQDEANGSRQLLCQSWRMLALFQLKASFLVKSPRPSMKSHHTHCTHAEKIKFRSFFQVGFSALMELHEMIIGQ